MRFEDPHAHASGPTGFPRISSGTARVVDVLDADPGLAEAAGASSSTGRPALPAVVVDVPCGVWKPPLKARPDAVGLLVLGGFLTRRTQYGASRSLELIAPGDLLRPWLDDGEGVILATSTWHVLEPARLALLSGNAAELCAAHPQVLVELLDRALTRSRRLALQNAIAATNRIDDRILLLLAHLAERWGRVCHTGVRVALPLTHALIAELVGARRPSVTTALSELRHAGALERTADGWLLTDAGRARLTGLARVAA